MRKLCLFCPEDDLTSLNIFIESLEFNNDADFSVVSWRARSVKFRSNSPRTLKHLKNFGLVILTRLLFKQGFHESSIVGSTKRLEPLSNETSLKCLENEYLF